MYTVYVLRSIKLGTFYTGQTENIENRLQEHNQGMSFYTKSKRPWELVYSEHFFSRSEAMKREKYLKTGAGRDFILRKLSEK
jgi:putative endonuclease